MMSRFFSEGMMPDTTTVFSLVEQDLNNQNYSGAFHKLVSISNQCSKDIRFLTLLGHTQRALKDYSGLVRTLGVISQITGTAVAQLDYMAALYTEGRLNEALDVGLILQERELSEINFKYLTRLLVKIYLEFSDYEGINEAVEKYQKIHGADDLMTWATGLAALAQGQQNQALELFRKSIQLNEQNDRAWVSLSMLHEEMGDRELALANIQRALDINPQNTTAMKLMARWGRTDNEISQAALSKIGYYLSGHSFDEDMSLCYVQLLKEKNDLLAAEFEVDKLILNNPSNAELLKIKNNLHDPMNP